MPTHPFHLFSAKLDGTSLLGSLVLVLFSACALGKQHCIFTHTPGPMLWTNI